MVLTRIEADIAGDRDRFSLTSFSAADSASGTLRAQGNVALSGPSGPFADLSATLANFRIAARDEALATASKYTISNMAANFAAGVTASL